MNGTNPGLLWSKTNAPVSSSRTDDIWFASPDHGWAVNSNGQILKTDDGWNSFAVQHEDDSVYLRCVGFAGTTIGWVGSISPAKRLFHTSNGGAKWTVVDNLPPTPAKICGISVVDEQVVYASGTNDPIDDPAVLKTTDGGASWTAIDMRAHAALLVDIHFQTRDRGWVVGGRDAVACPGRRATRQVVRPVVLFTQDGGASWTDLIPASARRGFPMGEWGWKIFFLNDRVAFVSLENFLDGAILKSTDGGRTWERQRINDRQRNSNLEGVGFISEKVGWVGGWEDTSHTQDGGDNWEDADKVGLHLNRFRFFGDPVTVGYASGDTIYRYSSKPAPGPSPMAMAAPAPLTSVVSAGPAEVVVDVPEAAKSLKVQLWDRFGNQVLLTAQDRPDPGERVVRRNPAAEAAARLDGNTGILRVTIDDHVESHLVALG